MDARIALILGFAGPRASYTTRIALVER